jgi:hypothetical protein
MIQGSIDQDAQHHARREPDRKPRRYLVVANLTAGGEQLVERIRHELRAGPCSFHLVVPASADPRRLTWQEGEVRRTAVRRLDHALSAFRALGADVSGEVGDWSPMLAVEDVLRTDGFDEIIVSTLPPGSSRWIRMDLAHRVEQRFDLPVSHVICFGDDLPADDERSRALPAGYVIRMQQHGTGDRSRPSARSTPEARRAANG